VPKRTTTFELTLPARDQTISAYRWLYAALRDEILAGRLRPGARLPATRDLATRYQLSRGTVVTAFEQLRSEGYIEGSIGSGTYVSAVLPDDLLNVARGAQATPGSSRPPRRHLSSFARRVRGDVSEPLFEPRPVRAFRANLPALDQFPTTLWAHLAARRMRNASASLLIGCGPMGYEPLRRAVAEYLSASRGVHCAPEQVCIVSGLQEAIDLTARLFLNPGDRVCVENPGYPDAANLFAAAGVRVSTLSLDDEGIKVPEGRSRDARLIYVTPGHQFPTGITMSLARRFALLDWARSAEALIFEDDYDSEYRYAGRPVPALQGLDRDGLVLFAGSFSKVLFSSLRLGYLVVPPDLVDYIAAAKYVATRHAHVPGQAVLCDFITQGHFGRHLRRMREIYAERLNVLLEESRTRLAGLLEISPIEAGLQTVGWLADGIDGEIATTAAAARGLEVIPLSRYWSGRGAREGLQLGFAALDAHEIRRGVRELAMTLEGYSMRSTTTGSTRAARRAGR
jgi:GntR family transcriptional regulator/MocR family aminotransferase